MLIGSDIALRPIRPLSAKIRFRTERPILQFLCEVSFRVEATPSHIKLITRSPSPTSCASLLTLVFVHLLREPLYALESQSITHYPPIDTWTGHAAGGLQATSHDAVSC